jgi:hypothetical protein
LEGVAFYTTEDILRIAREEEVKSTTKRPRKIPIVESSSEEEAEELGNSSDSADEPPPIRRRYATRSRGGERVLGGQASGQIRGLNST